jgi:predicted small integral membrane protein
MKVGSMPNVKRPGEAIMIKAITAIAAAAFIAALAIILPGMTPAVSANTPPEAGVQEPAVKGDRLPIHALGEACSQRAWPYYDSNCLFEARWQGDKARQVRLVTTDRLDPQVR